MRILFKNLRCLPLIVMMFINCGFLGCSQKSDNLPPAFTKAPSKITQEEAKIGSGNLNDWSRDEEKGASHVSKEGAKIDPNRQLVEWKPKGFDGKGQLKKTWATKIDKENEYGIDYAFAYPDSWYIEDWYAIDPITGKPPLRDNSEAVKSGIDQSLIGMELSGPTDGEYVFGCKWHVGLSSYCWRTKDGVNMWVGDLLAFGNSEFIIINNNLFHIDLLSDRVTKVKPWTGEKIWTIVSKSHIGRTLNSGHKQFTTGIAKTSNSLFILLENNHLYKININNGDQELVKSISREPIAIAAIGENLLVLSSDGSLSEVDAKTLMELKHFETSFKIVKDTDGVPSYYWIQSISSKVLIANTERSFKKTSFLYDTKNNSGVKFENQDVFAINSSLVIQSNSQIRCLDPDTLKPLWWIDLKDEGKNAHVAWLDWRGVLVISDETIACYVPSS